MGGDLVCWFVGKGKNVGGALIERPLGLRKKQILVTMGKNPQKMKKRRARGPYLTLPTEWESNSSKALGFCVPRQLGRGGPKKIKGTDKKGGRGSQKSLAIEKHWRLDRERKAKMLAETV